MHELVLTLGGLRDHHAVFDKMKLNPNMIDLHVIGKISIEPVNFFHENYVAGVLLQKLQHLAKRGSSRLLGSFGFEELGANIKPLFCSIGPKEP